MRRVIFLAAAATLLAGCAGTADPSGTWINQAAIDAASKDGKLREALLAYGPNLEWKLDSKAGEATFSNGFELGEGTVPFHCAARPAPVRIRFFLAASCSAPSCWRSAASRRSRPMMAWWWSATAAPDRRPRRWRSSSRSRSRPGFP